MEHLLAKEGVAGSIPVSRLKKERYQIGIVLFFEPCQGSKVRCLRSAPVRAVRGPPDLVRRLALLLFVAEALILQGFLSFYVAADLHPPAPSRFIASAIMLFLIILCFLCCFPGHQSCRRTSENKFTTGRKSGLWLSRYSLWNGSFQG